MTPKRQKHHSASDENSDGADNGLKPVLFLAQSKYLTRMIKHKDDGKITAPWCMLKVLFELKDDDMSDALSKEELMKQAQQYYVNPYEKRHALLTGPLFGAWSSVPKTLESKHLLVERKKRGKGSFAFQLTKQDWVF
jgi:hypothetical protein